MRARSFLYLLIAMFLFGCKQGAQTHNLEARPVEPQASPIASAAAQVDAAAKKDRAGSQNPYGSGYGIRPAYEKCMTHQPDGTSTAGHRQDCADLELEFQDARLNRVYQDVMASLKTQGDGGTARSRQLRSAQRTWLARTERMCAEAAEKAGSAMGPAAQSTCRMDQTARRADELAREYGSAGK